MRRLLNSLLWIILFYVLALPHALAQEPLPDFPDHALLTGLTLVWQDWNRCSAAALTMQLSYWRDDARYQDTLNYLNPYDADVSVRFDEMIAFAETYGLGGIARMGGTTDMLKRLVAHGFPVLVENGYYVDGTGARHWTSHNRVVVGYDDPNGVFYALDSVLGGGTDRQGRAFGYAEFEEAWRQMNHTYLVLYEPRDESRLSAILGRQWDSAFNAEWTLARAQANMYLPNAGDSFDHFNMSMALVALGEFERAIQAFEIAREMGLPWRMLWYQYGPLEAHLQLGRYDDVYALAREVLAYAPDHEEMYYYIGQAYLGQGNLERAQANLEAATGRNPNFTNAETLLAAVRGQASRSSDESDEK